MLDGVHLIERINTRGALIKVLDKPHLDLTTPIGRGFIAFSYRQWQRTSGSGSWPGATLAGRLPSPKGVKFGPKRKLTDHQQAEALERLAAGESCRSIAKTMAVHHATVARLAG